MRCKLFFSQLPFLVFGLLFFPTLENEAQVSIAENPISKVWIADRGDGTYKNPIIHADYSEPDLIGVGDDFYLTASSFNSAPGLSILHSKNLVNWTIINHVFARQKPFDPFDRPQHGNGVWAPSIRLVSAKTA
jgi:beta-xylosidase